VRILHILDHSIPLHSGYTFRSRSILKEQQRRGWDTIHLTTPKHIKDGPDPETVDGLTFHRTQKPNGLFAGVSGLSDLAQVAATAKVLDRLVAETKPDILHAHSPVLTAMAAIRVSRKYHVPLVYEIRGFWEDAAVSNGTTTEGSLRYRMTRWLETRLASQAHAVGGICKGILDDLHARGIDPAKMFKTPNAVDVDRFGQEKPADGALQQKLNVQEADVIGFIGSFYDYEGLDILLAAMPELIRLRPKLKFLLVGGGPMEASLKQQIQSLGIEDHVLLTGRVPHEEVERYYSLMDIMVYPRKKQRLTDLVTPLKPLEAMAEFKLVAASDIGGHRELIQHGVTGELFSPDNPSALARAVAGLFERREMWAARKKTAREFVETERSWARTVDNYEPVYTRLMKR
jgi:PEP-CTERM/exosortase A-associated glycosyltransferase